MEISEKGKPIFEILTNLVDYSPDFFIKSIPFSHFGKKNSSIITSLKSRLSQDLTYTSGKILGAMTTEPHNFAKYIHSQYINRNLGDQGLNPGTVLIEKDIVRSLGYLLGDASVQGNLTSGGTEANIIAMYLARQISQDILNPSVVLPESAHYSFDKAAALMGLRLKKARLNDDYSLDMTHYESLIDPSTIALVGVAGTSALGLVDPIDKIAQLARKYQLFLHVDAAFGGLVLPFLEKLGYSFPIYDFRLPEVSSITVDPHKMGMSINPSGCLLVRDLSLQNHGFEIPYLAGGSFRSYNILGTRPGAPAIAFWALLNYLGIEGYIRNVNKCWANTQYLIELLSSVPEIDIATEPDTNVVGIKLTSKSPFSFDEFDQILRKNGWALGKFDQWKIHRIVVMPHVKKRNLTQFVQFLKTTVFI